MLSPSMNKTADSSRRAKRSRRQARISAIRHGPERRGELRPAALTPVRSRLSDWTVWALFRLGDGVALAAAALWFTFGWGAGLDPLATAAQTAILFWSLHAVNLYGLGARSGLGSRWLRVVAGFTLAWGLCALAGLALGWPTPGAPPRLFWADLPLILALHGLWQVQTWHWRKRGRLTPNLVVVGATESARRLIQTFARTGEAAVLGVFDDRLERAPKEIAGVKVLGDTEQLSNHRILPFVDTLVIAVPTRAQARVRHLVERLQDLPNDIMLLVDHDRGAGTEAIFTRLSHGALHRVSGRPSDERRAFVKRIQDIVVGGLAIVLAAPILAAVALAIRLDSPGPIVFRQRRHGFNNEEIVIFKFRSMRIDAAVDPAARQVSADDDRVTRVGRFIRRTSLDELPQLLNVLTGEMSLVGPRPHAVGMKTGDVESAKLVAGYAHRHRLKPGITGWAAIHGSRGPLATAAQISRRVALDVEYIERQSFWLDLWIIIATAPRLIGDRNTVR